MENPDDLPRSPTGRVPKWVVEERLRGRVEETEFRPPPRLTPVPPARPPGRRRITPSLPAVVAVVVVALLGWVAIGGLPVGLGGSAPAPSGTTAGGPAAGTPAGPADFPTPGYEAEPVRLLPSVTPAQSSTSWQALQYQRDTAGRPTTTPVRWDPCRPIRYVMRPDGAPPGAAQLVAETFRTIERASGLKFVPDGTIDEAPARDRASFQPARYGDRWAPVLVAWQTPDENPDLVGDVAGQAGPAAVSVEGYPDVYVSGAVALDATKFRTYLADPRTEALARVVLLHELGHVVGLAHVDDPEQIMYPTADGAVQALGAGDLAGLAALGSGPCAPWL